VLERTARSGNEFQAPLQFADGGGLFLILFAHSFHASPGPVRRIGSFELACFQGRAVYGPAKDAAVKKCAAFAGCQAARRERVLGGNGPGNAMNANAGIPQVRGKSMTQMNMVQVDELVREIARALVDEPSAVEVESVDRDENTILKLRVAPQDVGKVIGKQGRTARSVRTILGAVSMKLHHRYTLDILEEDDEE
jgi:predicted RNA-binding protein YlqC (UPF0109 family)